MVKINRVYTRTGDTGETSLVGGQRVTKDCPRVCAYGDIDELNSFLGWARILATNKNLSEIANRISKIQNELFDLGALIASPPQEIQKAGIKFCQSQIDRLEEWIDQATEQTPELRSFVLPGGSELNSALHIARCVCRRSERSILSLSRIEMVPDYAIRYLNRLSDYLFCAARLAAKEEGVQEFLWVPSKQKT